ncbi:hypothetical protein TD95_004579 [Thielaviopsis punctulata]|uniref:nitric oxide dioxygenase n=1 Tax=Thielaviopsis punctulata TaxID=72032 RepID=A0A0F4ZJX3_9PEZI|nr:hypothetical protein TD95_004579 [Thielaviopsis punctulata]
MPVTPAQAALVKSTIPLLRHHGSLITTIFYRSLLTAHPHLSAIFNSANQTNGRQPRALTHLILAFAEHIHSLSELAPVLERVAQKHVSLAIAPADYAIVGSFLIQAFTTVLSPRVFTPDIQDAWNAAYAVLAHMLSSREAQLYAAFAPWTGLRPFRILRKVQETRTAPHVYSLYFEPVDGQPLPSFLPGQYVSLQIPVTGHHLITHQTRQYSLSDRPRPEYLRITLKKEIDPATGTAGIVSSALVDDYSVSDIVHLSHPAGEFFFDVQQHSNTASVPLVLISAGVGVAPMMSILNTILAESPSPPSSRGTASHRSTSPARDAVSVANSARLQTPTPTRSCSPASRYSTSASTAASTAPTSPSLSAAPVRPITWIHGSHSDAPFDIYIRSIAHTRRDFYAAIFKTEPIMGDVRGVDFNFEGRVDLAKLTDAELHLGHGGTEYMVCGPEGFMYEVRDGLVARGVDRSRVKCELFNVGDMLAARREI